MTVRHMSLYVFLIRAGSFTAEVFCRAAATDAILVRVYFCLVGGVMMISQQLEYFV